MDARVNPDFIGAGWAFPPTTDATGGIALVTREREVEQAIRIILSTARGERPMRPEFGCRIHDHVFGPANQATAGQIAYDVREALERWEPRVEVRDVDVGYVIVGSNDPRNLVFPFYVIPDHEPEAQLVAPEPALALTAPRVGG
jgi:phage baseplate assembly protein W